MSSELLVHLAERVAFDGSPSFNDLGAYHVEFDQLTDSGRVEARLADAVRRGERTALIAPSGAGKTSVISHVLGPTIEGVAPIVIPVHSLGEHAGNVGSVVDELLTWFTRSQATISDIDPDELASYASGDTRRVSRSHRFTTGVSLALGWFKGDLSKDLVAQVQYDQRISLAEKAATVDAALRRIHGDALQPVIVFDDTDRWTAAGADVDVVRNFFGEIIRWFTEFPASIVVATHSRYFDLGIERQDLLQFLDTRVEIPTLPHSSALHEILERRVALNAAGSDFDGAGIADAFDDDVVNALFKFYKSGETLRAVMQLVHSALAEATLAGDNHVSAAHINAARAR